MAQTVEHESGFDLVPTRERALPLTVTIEGFDGFTDNMLQVSDHGIEGAQSTRFPDCGCDACDDGSESLLAHLDETFLHALDGGVRAVIGSRGRTLRTEYNGWSASGNFRRDDPEQWIADAKAGRSRYQVIQGEPWL